MPSSKSEIVADLIWRGNLQMGDEPGIYGDAQYAGLCVDFPLELIPFTDQFEATGEVTVILEVGEVKVFAGYPGHPVTVYGYFKTLSGQNKWGRKELATGRLTNDLNGKIELKLDGQLPRYASVRIEIDTQLPPGLYDEIIVRQLSISSNTHYGYLGFRFSR